MDDLGGCLYWGVTILVWLAVFLGSWIYCIAEYGYLLGVGLGWLPSVIVASLAALLWPLAAIGAVILWVMYGR